MEPRHTANTITSAALDELYARLDAEEEASRRLLAQRQEMAEERYAWQERGDRAEAAVERARQLASRWAVMRAHGGAARELRAALDGPNAPDQTKDATP
ncbi:hypothetical protein ACFVFJ_44545 [Streptomyces sp. NPDC057717]|uniref:hypothetical protein n=1 Tax=Streptomyces sp. NPDC057717 TaxID=3346224 RepID=UPI0036960B29